MQNRSSRGKGFKSASSLLTKRIQTASESRGFERYELLTSWDDIAGPDIASIARPLEVSYGRGHLGATLTLVTSSANAPIVKMQEAKLKERIASVYGHHAIKRIRITHTSASGFAEAQAKFHRPKKQAAPPPANPTAVNAAQDVTDDGLRRALENLGSNILNRHAHEKTNE